MLTSFIISSVVYPHSVMLLLPSLRHLYTSMSTRLNPYHSQWLTLVPNAIRTAYTSSVSSRNRRLSPTERPVTKFGRFLNFNCCLLPSVHIRVITQLVFVALHDGGLYSSNSHCFSPSTYSPTCKTIQRVDTSPMSRSAVHKVLVITEILTNIFRLLSLNDLALSSRVCKAWSLPALDLLWRTVFSYHQLSAIIPSAVISEPLNGSQIIAIRSSPLSRSISD